MESKETSNDKFEADKCNVYNSANDTETNDNVSDETVNLYDEVRENPGIEYEDINKDTDISTAAKFPNVPVDKGWAWVVLAGCVLYSTVFDGIIQSFGIFFLQFQERFHASNAEVAIMSLIQNIVISLTGLKTMTVVLKKTSWRTVVAVSGGLIFLSHIISGLTMDIRVFYFSHGLFGGAGMAMISLTMMSAFGVYFKKHHGLASSIFTGGASIGGLIFAPVCIKLFKEYGYTGTMIIVAGLTLNSMISVALLRPPSWFRPRNKSNAIKEITTNLLMNTAENTVKQLSEVALPKLESICKQMNAHENEFGEVSSWNAKVNEDTNNVIQNIPERPHSYHFDHQCSPVFARTMAQSEGNIVNKTIVGCDTEKLKVHNCYSKYSCSISQANTSKYTLDRSWQILNGSSLNLKPVTTDNKIPDTRQGHAFLSSHKSNLNDILKMFDYNVLKDILYLVMAFCTVSGMALIPIYLPPFAKDTGMSYDDIGVMVSASAGTDFVSRILSGLIADRKWVRRSTLLALAAFATGTFCHTARFFTNQISITFMSVIMACFRGWYASMYAPILIDAICAEKFQSGLGFLCLIHGISIASFFPLSGLLRDISGSYITSLHLAGCLCYIGTVLLCLMSVIQRRFKANNLTEKDIAVER